MEIEKIIFDDSAGTVEVRNSTQVCVFMTQTGKEVLFSRDKNDNVVKTFEGKLDSADWAKARGIAGLKLEKKFLKKETYATTKIVAALAPLPRAQALTSGVRPVWLNTKLATAHANKIRTHTDDD